MKGARLLAGAGVDAAAGVDPLHRRDARQRAAAAMRRYLELEPGDIARRLAGDVGDRLADHRAAVEMLPIRPGIVTSDGFAVEQQRRDRLAERPCELAVAAGLALVDLRTLGMERDNGALPRRRDRRRDLRRCRARKDRGGDDRQNKYCDTHGTVLLHSRIGREAPLEKSQKSSAEGQVAGIFFLGETASDRSAQKKLPPPRGMVPAPSCELKTFSI